MLFRSDDLHFESVKLVIDSIDLVVEGYITGYDENKYIITTGTGRVIVSTHSTAEAPVGTEEEFVPVFIVDDTGLTFGVRTDKQPSLPGGGGLNISWDIAYLSEPTPNADISFVYPVKSVETDYDPTTVVVYHYNTETQQWEAYPNSTTELWAVNNDYYITTVYGVSSFSPFAVRTTRICGISLSLSPSILWPPNNQMRTIEATVKIGRASCRERV